MGYLSPNALTGYFPPPSSGRPTMLGEHAFRGIDPNPLLGSIAPRDGAPIGLSALGKYYDPAPITLPQNALTGLDALGAFYDRLGLPSASDPVGGIAPTDPAPTNWLRTLTSRKRVFISFQTEDLRAVELLRKIANSDDFDLEIYDESLKDPFNSHDDDYIRRGLQRHIDRTSVTICIVGETTYKSRWVDWECLQSLRKGNRVIGMCPPGVTQVVYPKFFEKAGASVRLWDVHWLQAEISAASRAVALGNP